MRDDGPPIMFVALWGLLAVALLYGQAQLLEHGYRIALPFQMEGADGPSQMASLD